MSGARITMVEFCGFPCETSALLAHGNELSLSTALQPQDLNPLYDIVHIVMYGKNASMQWKPGQSGAASLSATQDRFPRYPHGVLWLFDLPFGFRRQLDRR